MSNSQLISGILLSPNCSKPRRHKIDRITVHYMCWFTDAKTCCESFLPKSRAASANYCIGKNGEIWLNVDEKNRAWTSSSAYNDNRAITIECANYMRTENGHVYGQLPNATWNSLVKLCADICKRNGIKKLIYTGDDSGNLTMHKWYGNTDCPGPWLSKQFDRLAKEVNNILNTGEDIEETPKHNSDFSGLYRCTCNFLNVRAEPNLHGSIVSQYNAGDTVTLDDWYTINDGYVWGRYTGSQSGLKRYIAVGRATGKPEKDDFLIKVI